MRENGKDAAAQIKETVRRASGRREKKSQREGCGQSAEVAIQQKRGGSNQTVQLGAERKKFLWNRLSFPISLGKSK